MSSRGTPIWVRADGRGAGMWEPWRLRPATVLQGGGGQDQRRCCIAPVQAPGVFSYADLVRTRALRRCRPCGLRLRRRAIEFARERPILGGMPKLALELRAAPRRLKVTGQ